MKVSDLMQRHVVTAREEQSLKALAETLFDHGISGMPVVGADGAVVGVVSEADLLHKQGGRSAPRKGALARFRRAATDSAATDTKLGARTVGEAMTAPAVTVGPESTVAAAARLMLDHGINRLPVVGRDGELLGIPRAPTSCVRSAGRTMRSRRRSGTTSCSASSGPTRSPSPSRSSAARSSSWASWSPRGRSSC